MNKRSKLIAILILIVAVWFLRIRTPNSESATSPQPVAEIAPIETPLPEPTPTVKSVAERLDNLHLQYELPAPSDNNYDWGHIVDFYAQCQLDYLAGDHKAQYYVEHCPKVEVTVVEKIESPLFDCYASDELSNYMVVEYQEKYYKLVISYNNYCHAQTNSLWRYEVGDKLLLNWWYMDGDFKSVLWKMRGDDCLWQNCYTYDKWYTHLQENIAMQVQLHSHCPSKCDTSTIAFGYFDRQTRLANEYNEIGK